MRKVMASFALVAAASAATPAFSEGWKQLDGQPAPAFLASQWLNVEGPAPSRERLKGRVWLLNFVGIH